MTIYVKKVRRSNPIFHNREIRITSGDILGSGDTVAVIPVPDSTTLCNGCNQNIEEGYLVYLGKRELKANQPYDYYCPSCVKRYFGKATLVE